MLDLLVRHFRSHFLERATTTLAPLNIIPQTLPPFTVLVLQYADYSRISPSGARSSRVF